MTLSTPTLSPTLSPTLTLTLSLTLSLSITLTLTLIRPLTGKYSEAYIPPEYAKVLLPSRVER